jgi:cytochrome c5
VSQDHDKQFFNTFGIVIGILVAITIAIIAIAGAISARSIDSDNRRNPYAQAQAIERIQPPGEVAVAGAAAAEGGEAVEVAASDDNLGQQTYQRACFACHGTGAAGAPRIGDADDWGTRAGQGRDVLIQHSIEGFMGDKGYMPPKGGQAQLSDEAVVAALDYMLEQSR